MGWRTVVQTRKSKLGGVKAGSWSKKKMGSERRIKGFEGKKDTFYLKDWIQ